MNCILFLQRWPEKPSRASLLQQHMVYWFAADVFQKVLLSLVNSPRLPVSNLPATSGTSKSEIVSVLKNCEENPLRVGCPIWCLTTVPISVSFLAIAIHFGRTGDQLFMIEEGSVDSETMFSIAHQKNTFRTWMIRLFGCLLTFIGFWIILFEVFLECGIH